MFSQGLARNCGEAGAHPTRHGETKVPPQARKSLCPTSAWNTKRAGAQPEMPMPFKLNSRAEKE